MSSPSRHVRTLSLSCLHTPPSQPAAPDYETLLSRLSTEIAEAKTHLSEIRLRERRLTLLINAYGVALWAIWAGLWWIGGLPLGLFGWDSRGNEASFVGIGGVGAGPLVWVLWVQVKGEEC
jgi:hypothetical protein